MSNLLSDSLRLRYLVAAALATVLFLPVAGEAGATLGGADDRTRTILPAAGPTPSSTTSSDASAADLARRTGTYFGPAVSDFSLQDPASGVFIVYRDPVFLFTRFRGPEQTLPVRLALLVLLFIVLVICMYAVRHYLFTHNRLFGRQRHPYVPIDEADWPHITVLVPCHNEEAVVEHIMDALLSADYPADRMRIIPVNDRSTDRTAEILDRYAANHPDRIRPVHRMNGAKPGKSAALQDALPLVTDDIILVFDADYVPGPDLIKRLSAPFLDPEVGASMGRVVPLNTPTNLLTRMLDLERAAGYQVDQQARMNLQVVAQYGGTVGGVRVSALRAVGGWREDSLAEDTDITFRLVLGGWKIAYSNRYECYEEVPESWPARSRQIMRWAQGHTDAAIRYGWGMFRQPGLRMRERIDGALLLGTYLLSPLIIVGWFLALFLYMLGANPLLGVIAILSIAAYGTVGNFAAFFEIAAAARLDGTYGRIQLLPLVLMGFLVSVVASSRAVVRQLFRHRRSPFEWDKTDRYRTAAPPEFEPNNRNSNHDAAGTAGRRDKA